jgi:regulation of enolase protein 1 (concanavalin A-like superfamily)
MYRLPIVVLLSLTVLPCPAADPVQKLIPGWGTAVDPDGDCSFDLNDAALTITAPGPVHDLSAELGKMNAPRVLRPAKGDFAVEVLVKGEFKPGEATIPVRTAYHGAGLLLMADDQTYIRLDRATLVRDGMSQHYANFELRVKGMLTRFGTPVDYTIDPERDTFLRLEKNGNIVSGAVSQQAGQWHDLGTKEAELPDEVLVGIAAINASTQPFRPIFARLSVKQAGVEGEPSPSDQGPLPGRATEEASVQPRPQAGSAVQKSSAKACSGCRAWRFGPRLCHRNCLGSRLSIFSRRKNACAVGAK